MNVKKTFRLSINANEKFTSVLEYFNKEAREQGFEYTQTEIIEKAIDSLYDKTIGKEMGRVLKDELGDTISLAVANGLSALSDNLESRLGLIYHKLSHTEINTELINSVLYEQRFFPNTNQEIADLIQDESVVNNLTKGYLENLIKTGKLK